MSGIELICIPLIALIAFYLKGVTGTGTGTVVVSLASLIIDPKAAVVLAAFMNIFGGLSMVRIDPAPLKPGYWIPIAATMVVGAAIGAVTLDIVPGEIFQLILGTAFLAVSGYFFVRPHFVPAERPVPEKANTADNGIGLLSGFCGGFIGVNAPVLILHFSRYLDKRHLRRLLVLIFIPAAIVQTVCYTFNGLLTEQIVGYGLLMLPAMAAGIYLGNRAFHKISEALFRKILAVFLLFVSIHLIWDGLKAFL